MNKTITDLSYLREVGEGSDAFVIQMINVFIMQTPLILEEMNKHLQDKKWTELRSLAHKIKPTLHFVGMHGVADVIVTIEKYAEDQSNHDDLKHLLNRLSTDCFLAIDELKTELKRIS